MPYLQRGALVEQQEGHIYEVDCVSLRILHFTILLPINDPLNATPNLARISNHVLSTQLPFSTLSPHRKLLP